MTILEKTRPYFKKAIEYIKSFFVKARKIFVRVAVVFTSLVIVLAISAGIVWVKSFAQEPKKAEIIEASENEFDLKLSNEVEKRVVTVEEIKIKLAEIGQLATYYEDYQVTKEVEHTRYFIDDWKIPMTTNIIHMECDGIVKVGYDIEKIVPIVDCDSQKIFIPIPEAKVLDNYIKWDNVYCEETNNILNPIDFEQYKILIEEIEDLGLIKAEEEGIYEKAEDNLKKIIKNFLSGFEEYEIVFI